MRWFRSLAAGTGELASGMKDLSSNMSGLTDGLRDGRLAAMRCSRDAAS